MSLFVCGLIVHTEKFTQHERLLLCNEIQNTTNGLDFQVLIEEKIKQNLIFEILEKEIFDYKGRALCYQLVDMETLDTADGFFYDIEKIDGQYIQKEKTTIVFFDNIISYLSCILNFDNIDHVILCFSDGYDIDYDCLKVNLDNFLPVVKKMFQDVDDFPSLKILVSLEENKK